MRQVSTETARDLIAASKTAYTGAMGMRMRLLSVSNDAVRPMLKMKRLFSVWDVSSEVKNVYKNIGY